MLLQADGKADNAQAKLAVWLQQKLATFVAQLHTVLQAEQSMSLQVQQCCTATAETAFSAIASPDAVHSCLQMTTHMHDWASFCLTARSYKLSQSTFRNTGRQQLANCFADQCAEHHDGAGSWPATRDFQPALVCKHSCSSAGQQSHHC